MDRTTRPAAPRHHEDRNLALLLGVPIVLLAALVLPWFVHHWIERAGAQDIHDPATLPEVISACGRDWHRAPQIVRTTLDVERARSGVEPIVVDIAPFAPCPSGPCTPYPADPCATVVYVRVAETGYVGFELEGGP